MKLRNVWHKQAATLAVNFSKERFVRKNWVDDSREPWKDRAREDRGSLMIRTGRLKRSIRKIKASRNSVTIGTNVPYAEIHNEGMTDKTVRVRAHTRKRKDKTVKRKDKTVKRKDKTVKVKAHSRKMDMPQRRFIGESALLQRRLERNLQKQLNNILK